VAGSENLTHDVGLAPEGEETRARNNFHGTAYKKPRSENPASVDRLQSLVAGLAGSNQRDLKPYLKSGMAIKPDLLHDPAKSRLSEQRQSRSTMREGEATRTVTVE